MWMFLMMSIFVLILIGCFFALSLLILGFKKRARESQAFRKKFIIGMSLITFCVTFFGIHLLNAVGIDMLWDVGTIGPDPCTVFTCNDNDREILEDGKFQPIIIAELWLQNITPPFMNVEDQCFTGNDVVCYLVNKRNDYGSEEVTFYYFFGLLMFSIPGVICASILFYMTRHNHKEKQKLDV